MTQQFLSSVNHPFALVAHGSKQPGKRPGTAMAWLEWRAADGMYDGGEIRRPRRGVWRKAEWVFMYKHPKTFAPEDILHVFKIQRGVSSDAKDLHHGGPTNHQIRAAKLALPVIPERETFDGWIIIDEGGGRYVVRDPRDSRIAFQTDRGREHAEMWVRHYQNGCHWATVAAYPKGGDDVSDTQR